MSVRKNTKIIAKFFKKDDWRYEFDEKNGFFTCGVGVGNVVGNAKVYVNVEDDKVTCVYTFPVAAPESVRGQVAELVCRLGYKLAFGSFDMDFDDGELRYRYVMPSEELEADPMEKAQRLLYLPHAMITRYGSAFIKVVLGARTPKEAIKEAEGDIDGGDTPAEPDGESPNPDVEVAKSVAAVDVKPSVPEQTDMQKHTPTDNNDDKTPQTEIPVPVRDYTLDGLSIKGDIPLSKIVAAVKNFRKMQAEGEAALPDRPRMNLLLWGPPGTGKTEFVNYLGQQLGCKVVVKMASDLLDHWVGKTEKAIRAAFEEAEEENAILFLDELDGLMQDRSGAIANWEVTQVNELLDCMERFKGVMVGATNFMDHLDAAVLRRFTYKLEFGYLEPDGKHIFFDRAFKSPLTEKDTRRLDAIPNLAPGDFKTVSQRFFYLGEEVGNEERLSALEQEVALKKGTHKVCLGFSAT